MRKHHILPLFVLAAAFVFLLTSCSTKKNTAGSRWWQSFTARYNTFFNGHQAFLEGEKAKSDAHKDNYTEMLPVFLVGNEKSRTTGKSNYETAITKCQKAIQLHSIKKRPVVSANKKRTAKQKAYLSRKEFNPFLKKAWLLMGEAQFEKGEFLEAASTFSYITRLYAPEPDVVAEARQWLARCYTQSGWFYDAEDALQKVRRDSVSKQTTRRADATQADLLLRQQRFADALPYLQSTARHAKGKLQRARMQFLLGQVNQQLGNWKAANKAYAKCISMSPPFELAFNARIRQAETMAEGGGQGKKMISKLRRMARNENNKEYLDQVYYAIGNIYLSEKDTANAVDAFEKGRAKATRNGIEKGVLLLRLGEIYWTQRKFDKAQACYTEALGLVGKDYKNYEEIKRRSTVLDKLVPYTSAVYLQDSLQELSRMSEADRNAAIDRVIDALKKKEAEERRAKADSASEARAQANAGNTGNRNQTPNQNAATQRNKQQTTWYFYDPMQVMQGKQDFTKQWGKRKNEDNWRRSNRTMLAESGDEGYNYEAEDSIKAANDSIAAAEEKGGKDDKKVDPSEDPHERAYYMKQIPFTDEARAASDDVIMDGLYNAGVVEKDDLEDFPLAEETLTRLTKNYTRYEKLSEAYYQLFLLYSRWGRADLAAEMKRHMLATWPDDEHTKTISAPDYELLARYGKQIEDSLYTATYDAYRQRQMDVVEANFSKSTEKFAKGINRPKFIFIHVLSRLNTASTKELTDELRSLVKDYPEADVTPMAGMILKGLESGRKVGSGTFDIGSLWGRRTAAADSTQADAAKQRQFSAEHQAPFLFVLAYPNDSVDNNKLLYEMAHFNFTTFVARGFDMAFQTGEGITQFRVSGFRSFEEAHAYAQRVFAAPDLRPFLDRTRVLIISKENLEMVGVNFSYDDYKKFYDATFAPLNVPQSLPLDNMPPSEQHYEDDLPGGKSMQPALDNTGTDDPNAKDTDSSNTDDDGETYDDDSSTSDDGEWYSE